MHCAFSDLPAHRPSNPTQQPLLLPRTATTGSLRRSAASCLAVLLLPCCFRGELAGGRKTEQAQTKTNKITRITLIAANALHLPRPGYGTEYAEPSCHTTAAIQQCTRPPPNQKVPGTNHSRQLLSTLNAGTAAPGVSATPHHCAAVPLLHTRARAAASLTHRCMLLLLISAALWLTQHQVSAACLTQTQLHCLTILVG